MIQTFASRTNNRQKENNFLELINCFAGQNLGLTFALMTQDEFAHLILRTTVIDISTSEIKKSPLTIMQCNSVSNSVGSTAAYGVYAAIDLFTETIPNVLLQG